MEILFTQPIIPNSPPQPPPPLLQGEEEKEREKMVLRKSKSISLIQQHPHASQIKFSSAVGGSHAQEGGETPPPRLQ